MIWLPIIAAGCSRSDATADGSYSTATTQDSAPPCIDDPPRWVNTCSATSPPEGTVDGCMRYRPDEDEPPACTMTESLAAKCESLAGHDGCECISTFVRAYGDYGFGTGVTRCVDSNGVALDVISWIEPIPNSYCEGGSQNSYLFTARFTSADGPHPRGELVEIHQEFVSGSIGSCSAAWCCGEGGVVAPYLSWGEHHRLESCETPPYYDLIDVLTLLGGDTGCP